MKSRCSTLMYTWAYGCFVLLQFFLYDVIPNHVNTSEDEEEMNGSVADLYIRMEFCEHRTFRKLIESGDIVRDRFRMSMQFRQLVESVNYFHKMNFIHQDLKVKFIFLRYRS